MRFKITAILVSLAAIFPAIVHGAVRPPNNFRELVGIVTDIIGTLIILVFALTFIAFMWGIIKGWIIGGGDTEGVDEGKKVILTGIIVLVIMSSIWGILALLKTSFFGQ